MMHRLATSVGQNPAYGVSIRCPHCRHVGIFAGLSEVSDVTWATKELKGASEFQASWSAGVRRCPNGACLGLVFVVRKNSSLYESYPAEQIDFDSSNLPEPILATLEEAIRCHGAGAYKASTLMVRRLLEELCADRGAKGSDLKKRLEALSQTIVVPKELLDAADELRILGNDAAHIEAKTYDAIGKDEAEIAIELAKELLKAVYQYAALVGRLKGLRKASV